MSAEDLVIQSLADEVADLRARLSTAELFREMAKEAIEQLAMQNAEIESQRRRIAALTAELRASRDSVTA